MIQSIQQKQRHYSQSSFLALKFLLLISFISSVSVSAWTNSNTVSSLRNSNLSSRVNMPPQLRSTTEDKTAATDTTTTSSNNDNNEFPVYTTEQLKQALLGLLDDSSNPTYDGRHLFGFDDYDKHHLSKLQEITATRILDYEKKTKAAPTEKELIDEMNTFWNNHGPLLNLQTVIQNQAPTMALAAEFKRASPSKGNIATHLNAGEQALKYAKAGANIISVLTEPRWFQGTLHDMEQVRLRTTEAAGKNSSQRPAVLRKEFTTSKYQITEALAHGADTILLIVAVLPQHLLKELIDHARSLGMEPLVEVHADVELEVALEAGAKVIGVNNRNLHTFQMDLHTTEHVADLLIDHGCTFDHSNALAAKESKYTLCSLSGMSTAWDVDRYRKINVGMCLIGESLMRAADPTAAIAGLCLDPKDWEEKRSSLAGGGAYTGGTKLVKVCGVTNPEDALVACQAGANLIGVIFVPKSKRCVTPEQGRAVVDAVRSFGERTQRTKLRLTESETASPTSQMMLNAHALEDASRRPLVVGVFQNQSPEFIQEMVESCGLDVVQLHGSEGMEAANEKLCGVPAIRVVDIDTDPETGKASENAVETILDSITKDPLAILLDTAIKGEKAGGGTGVTFDHTIAEKVQSAGLPVIIAGGLTPENVPDAIMSTRPWGVDVSSGTEASPGTKDHDKVKTFVKGVRTAAIEASKGF